MIEMRPDGRRKRGRPNKTWLDCVKEKRGVNEGMKEERVKWREITHKAEPK